MDSLKILVIILCIVIATALFCVYLDNITQYKVIDYDNNEYIITGADLDIDDFVAIIDGKRVKIKSWEEIK